MPDQPIRCADCGRTFHWTAGEQAFYRERGLQAPRRCPDCRSSRRAQAAPAAPASPRAAPPRPLRRPARPGRASPRRSYGTVALAAAAGLSLALLLLIPSAPLLAWLIGVNLVTLLAFGYDKAIAGGEQMRVPEAVLLGLALVGGSPGGFIAMLLFRHKSSKSTFLGPFLLIVVLQLALGILWTTWGRRL